MVKEYIAEVINKDGCVFDSGKFGSIADALEFCKGRGSRCIGNVTEIGEETPFGFVETLVATYR